ncbi:ShlB/FhaC/HecB family hemolysin secretion/activation protein [Pyruvatibacter mobilis]|uniref:ShlB/FhaC/HecB family hemolysin secretion/activation protein n=1 Tax=Pyruvatibacter mobilis TaxID=1712261 RepID=UPI003BB060CD
MPKAASLYACIAVCPILASALLPAAAYAQASQSADPSRIEEQVRERVQPDKPAPVDGLRLGVFDRSAGSVEGGRFILTGITVEGANVISGEAIAATYSDLLATEVGPAELDTIAGRITALYRDRGYVLSRAIIPPQDIAMGLITIEVIEGHVEQVTTSGAVPVWAISGYADRITAERPLTLATLERNMLLINDRPGTALEDAVLTEDKARPGAYTLDLKIGLDRFGGAFFTDNRGSAEVGPIQTGLSAEIRNALSFGDAITLTAFTVPQDTEELRLLRLAYATSLGSSGLQGGIQLTASEIDAGGTNAAFGDESSLRKASLQLSYPVIRAREQALWVNGQLDIRSAREKTRFGEVFDENLVVLRGSISGMATDGLGGRTYATFKVSKGVRLLNSAKKGDPLLSRRDADPQAASLELSLSRHQPIIDDWLSLTLSGRAQRATGPLVSSEEFSLGGARYGRGYEYGELTGDDGIAGSVELTLAPDLSLDPVTGPALYLFYDTGAIWNRNIFFGDSRQSLSSAGAGIRLTLAEKVSAGFELAKPLDRDTSRTNTQEWQGLFFVSGEL